MNKIEFSTNFQIMIKKLLLFPLTLIVLSSCSYPSSREAGDACRKWLNELRDELKKEDKAVTTVKCVFDESSRKFLGYKYFGKDYYPDWTDYENVKVIKRFKF